MSERVVARGSFWKASFHCALLACVYLAVGVFSQRVIESPFTRGAPLWPAAGIALAALFRWGLGLWPGVLLGAALVQVVVACVTHHDLSQRDVAVAALLGVGAALQALLGVLTLRHVFGSEFRAIRGRDIWLFVFVVVPGICLINASWSAAVLWSCGSIENPNALLSWFSWWIGDVIGTLIGFTGVWIFWGLPRDVWRPRRASVGIPLVLLLVSLVGYVVFVNRVERDHIRDNVNHAVPLAHKSLDGWLKNATVALKDWTEVVGDWKENRDLVLSELRGEPVEDIKNALLGYHDTIYGIGVGVAIDHSDRTRFEAGLRTLGNPAPTVSARDANGELVPAGIRERYMGVAYYATRSGTHSALCGYDLYSDPHQREAIDRAVLTGGPVACATTAPFGRPDRRVLLMVLPFYHPGEPVQTAGERAKARRGVAFALYDLDAIVARAQRAQILSTSQQHFSVSIPDSATHPGGGGDPSDLYWVGNRVRTTKPIEVGSLALPVRYEVDLDLMNRDVNRYRYLMSLFWLVIAMLVVAGQLLISGRLFAIEGEVQLRTAELRNEIAERARVESKLLTIQASLEDAESQAQLGSWERDLNGNALWCSDEYYRVIGRDPSLGPPGFDEWLEYIHPDDRGEVLALRGLALESGQTKSIEIRSNPQQGPVRYFHFIKRTIRDSSGRPVGTAGTIQNITIYKLMERDLRQARDELEQRVRERTRELVVTNDALRTEMRERELAEAQFRQAQKMEVLGQLAGGVAHDFNNLLTVMSGYAELLGSYAPLDAVAKEWAGEIFHTSQRATLLTRQLLTFSRKHIHESKTIDLNGIVRDAAKLSMRLVGENILLRINLAPDPLYVRGDPSQMEQILLNLAVNARDAMPSGGTLTVETSGVTVAADRLHDSPVSAAGAYVVLTVADTGCGMSPEVQARVFEPFFTTKGPGKGTGLGLATVFGIVKQSGGGIGLVSEVGKGTTFHIYIPQFLADPGGPTSRSTEIIPTGSETILLAEDEEGVRQLAQQILENCGYKVLAASDGLTAMRLTSEYNGPIDLLISDIVMPHLSGLELLARLRETRPELKVLLFSGYADCDGLRNETVLGEVPFLNKPFTVRQLAQSVRASLDHGNRV